MTKDEIWLIGELARVRSERDEALRQAVSRPKMSSCAPCACGKMGVPNGTRGVMDFSSIVHRADACVYVGNPALTPAGAEGGTMGDEAKLREELAESKANEGNMFEEATRRMIECNDLRDAVKVATARATTAEQERDKYLASFERCVEDLKGVVGRAIAAESALSEVIIAALLARRAAHSHLAPACAEGEGEGGA